MTNRVLLNNIDHHDLRVRLGYGSAFGHAVNQVPVFPTEFEEVQRDYPIVLRRDDSGYRAFALLGLDRDENLFLENENWDARYVPALLQRGPFSVGQPQPETGGEPTIHVDLDDPRVGREAGQPLFLEHGGNAPFLDHIAAVLRAIYVGHEVSAPMFAAWDALGLIDPVKLEIEIGDGRRYDVPDCYTIEQARLAGLDGAGLETLHRDDFLRPAIWAASSLRNIGRLIDRKTRRQADG